jgi:tetratricopeptide (TPR) repeat protein/CHAT domain-containing protein
MKGWEPEVDESEQWFDRGNELFELGRYEESISSFGMAIELNPYNDRAWSNKGGILCIVGRYEESIYSFDQAIKLNPNNYEAWRNRGIALKQLERNEEAIISYDQAIKINANDDEALRLRSIMLYQLGRYVDTISNCDQAIKINPDNDRAWRLRGSALNMLQRYEEAISNCDQEIKIDPSSSGAWQGKGNALDELGRYEEAIISYDQAIEIEYNDPSVWLNRGITLDKIGRYEEAIISLDRSIEIEPDDFYYEHHKAWYSRGIVMGNLKRHEEAIASYDQVIEIKPDYYLSWQNRGIETGNLKGYQAEIDAYNEAFKHIHSDTHPEGWGYLQHKIGRTHYQEGKKQSLNYQHDHQDYYGQAIISYKAALTTLTSKQFPKLRLETLIDTAKAHLAQKHPSAARECQTEALTIWLELIDAQPTPQGKKRLYLEYSYLLRTQVDLSILDGEPIRALETAEFDKNKHLEWFLYSQAQQGQAASLLLAEIDQMRLNVVGLQYPQMRQLLSQQQAIVYWHLSPDNLTTFILHPHQPNPQILTNSSQQLRNWLKTYDTDKLDTANWQELGNILQISEINRHLDGIEHLILIPHRDLHRLPLHTYWQNLTTTYLPSIQIGLNLKNKPQPNPAAGFLLVDSPNYSQTTTEQKKGKVLGLLPSIEIEVAVIQALFSPRTTIPRGKISTANLTAKLQQPHYYGHFNGHAYHDPRQPQNSSLILENDNELTCSDLSAIDLTPYQTIVLSACQTGVTTHQTIDTEYVGIVSAFLSRGNNYVVSTLWSVKDLPSSLLMMTFYLYLKKGNPAPLALRKAANWLRNLTPATEAKFWCDIYELLKPKASPTLLESIQGCIDDANDANKENPAAKPYSSPYYWAAFTISGWG